ncbi:hypothetical protein F3D3_0548 [Fusibacter sp. 3D3]|nr:hypothetical protein F3D3_0548 [Fusibacter sp. 3D3]
MQILESRYVSSLEEGKITLKLFGTTGKTSGFLFTKKLASLY